MKHLLTYNLFENVNVSLHMKETTEGYSVFATKNKEVVGELKFIKSKFKPNLIATSIVVQPNYRRQGIASSMYEFAEKQLKMKFLKTDDVLTADGKALWNNPNRKFGIK